MYAAGPSNSGTSRYLVQTTDVIQDMRVNVSNEHSPNNIIWYKERFLSDNEIVENLVHNPTSTIQWTIHRPIRGWYIRLRSPTFPPGVFIPLTPVPSSSPLHTDAAISFNTRTNIAASPSLPYIPEQRGSTSPEEGQGEEEEQDVASTGLTGGLPTSESQFTLTSDDEDNSKKSKGQASTSSLHSYPPTPTITTPRTSTSSYTARPPRISTSKSTSKQRAPAPSTQITQFLLAPHDPLAESTHHHNHQQQQQESQSLFSRALSLLKSHRPRTSNTFVLSRVVPPGGGGGGDLRQSLSSSSLPPPPYASNISLASSHPASSTTHILPSPSTTVPSPSSPFSPFSPFTPTPTQPHSTIPTLHTTPLLTFHDHTPLLTVRSLTGILELDRNEERLLGVDTSFWVAVALCYLEFLEERESYLAALSD